MTVYLIQGTGQTGQMTGLSCIVSCLDIQATIDCEFTLKRVRDMIKTYNQMHRTDKYSQHSSIIWPVWLNG